MSIPLIIAGAALISSSSIVSAAGSGSAPCCWLGRGEVIATDPAIEPMLHHLLDGTVNISIDATSALWAGKSTLTSHVDGRMET